MSSTQLFWWSRTTRRPPRIATAFSCCATAAWSERSARRLRRTFHWRRRDDLSPGEHHLETMATASASYPIDAARHSARCGGLLRRAHSQCDADQFADDYD